MHIRTLRAGALLAACALAIMSPFDGVGAGPKKKKDKRSVQRRAYQILKPTIELQSLEESPAVQEVGGVRIELMRRPVEVQPMYFVHIEQRETTLGQWTGINSVGRETPVWISTLPFYEVTPKNLQFKVRITNHLGRVLRLQGVALQFLKDGEPLSIDNVENHLNKVMILPEKSWEGTIQGPSLEEFGLKAFDARTAQTGLLDGASVASEGVLMVGLYDIVTEMDQASNPTKRSNFEWIFGYAAKADPEDAEALRWKGKLTAERAKELVGDQPVHKIAPLLPGNTDG